MQLACFISPYDSTFKVVKRAILKKQYAIHSINETEGTIKAYREKGLFRKRKQLDIQISKTDNITTRVILMVNGNHEFSVKFRNPNQLEEEKLMNTIHKYF